MRMNRIITLIADNPSAHGVLATHTETRRKIPCEVVSVGRTELYAAKGVGLEPSIVAIIQHGELYKGEKLCEICGVKYDVLRAFSKDFNTVELTLQSVVRNASGG